MPLLLFLRLCLASLLICGVSCSTQAQLQPDGTRLVNNNLFAKGGLTVDPTTGAIVMFGDSADAAVALGDYARAVLIGRVIQTGLGAAVDLTETVTDAVTE